MHRSFSKATLFVLAGSFALCIARASTPSPARYAIALEQVTSAVLLAHPEFAGDAIELAAPVEARELAPHLSAGLIEHATMPYGVASSVPAPVRLQMRCAARGICLPFYVIVHVTGREAAMAAAPLAASQSNQIAPGDIQSTGSKGGALVTKTDEQPLLKSGAAVMLVIDSGMLHLRLSAICLQGGREGAMIRVRSAKRGLVYKAEVLNSHTVRGSL